MKEFRIYQHPTGKQEAVKQGWSWPGFFFGPIWALVKKLWGLGAVLLVVVLMLSALPVETEVGMLASLIVLVIYIVCGVNGNNWREKNLRSRGYDQLDTVSAANPDGAIAAYIKSSRSHAE
ncbi:DUF2628 domain-containing protein [Halomonas aquatica]|uniref:DUF2628 domain-containing protein n=1 Tax=Halomonas aquatica TaxID=3151123 RepID=A0ABV1NAF6_9GAMM